MDVWKFMFAYLIQQRGPVTETVHPVSRSSLARVALLKCPVHCSACGSPGKAAKQTN